MNKLKIRVGISIILLGLAIIACDERMVDKVDYIREMNRFINESLDGQELFSTDIYPEEIPFSLDESEDLYFYRVENVSRQIVIDSADLSEPPDTFYDFYDIGDAVATIYDDFSGSIYRIRENDTTLAYGFESYLQRSAYFLKLYGDAYQYHGWRFWGYSTLNYSIDGRLSYDTDENFYATATRWDSIPNNRLGRYYVLKHHIPKLPLGDSITFHSNYWHRIFAENSNEEILEYLHDPDNGVDNTGWRVPTASDRFYHLITFDSDTLMSYFRVDTLSVEGDNVVVESTLVKDGDYVIPFAVDI